MKLAVMQPYFLPYYGYFQLMHAAEVFVILDDVNYINRGWINRNRFLINGEAKYLSLPLEDASQNRKINETLLVADTAWKNKFLKTIEFAYKKAPLFNEIMPLVNSIIFYENRNLSEFLIHSLELIIRYLHLPIELRPGSAIYLNGHLKAQEKILDICRQEKAKIYINLPGGRTLYRKEDFENKGIDLTFIEPLPCSYTQFKNEFIPALSFLDVMMFNSIPRLKEILGNYKLNKM